MTAALEREIKLRFEDPETARAAILRAGATPVRCRRLREDCLLDTLTINCAAALPSCAFGSNRARALLVQRPGAASPY